MSDLPRTLEDLGVLIGMSAALTLVRAFGGTRIFVPANIHVNHPLAQLIGLTSAQRLASVYAGTRLSIPLYSTRMRAVRNSEINQRYRQGETTVKLARNFGMSERSVWRILAADDDRVSPDELV